MRTDFLHAQIIHRDIAQTPRTSAFWICLLLAPTLRAFIFGGMRKGGWSAGHSVIMTYNGRKRSLVFPSLLFSSISLHWLLKKAFLALLAILWNSAFRYLYLSFSPLLFASLLFTAICKVSPDSHFAFLHFFSMGMVLIPVSCTMSRTSIHSSSGTLSDLVP